MATRGNRGPSALQQLQDEGGYSQRAAEVLDWTYYDSFALATGTLVNRLFTIPLGQSSKTLAMTNLPTAGQLPQGQNMRVHNIKIGYVTDAAMATADVQYFYSMLYNTTLEIVIPGKDSMGTWGLWEIFGICSATALTPTAAGDNIRITMPKFTGIYPLNFPLKIGATQSFEARITHHVAANTALDGNRLFIGLNGRLIRMS